MIYSPDIIVSPKTYYYQICLKAFFEKESEYGLDP